MILLLPSQATVLHAYAVMVGMTPGNAAFKDHQAYIASAGTAGYKAALESYFAGTSTATLASSLLTNLGLSASFTQAQSEAFLNANPGNRVGAMIDLAAGLFGYSGSDVTLAAARAAYVTAIETSYTYSNNTANVDGKIWVGANGQTSELTTGFDNLMGSALNDSFVARTMNNGNTLQDGDKVDGAAGIDTIYADFNAVTNGAVHTPNLNNIETVVVRAQTTSTDGANENNLGSALVQIDAQRSLATDVANKVTANIGVTRWEDSNSRADVVIEDVRIGNGQKTKDITVAMVETDPGNVDFGLYFDQLSLRNASSSSSSLTINIMDTGAAANAATAATPLLNNPYDTFKLGINGVLSTISLDKTAVAAADTYAQLLAVFNTALAGTGVTASLAGTFTITDPISNTAVTGQSIVLSSTGSSTITTPTGSGWFNTTGASVPATSNIYTTYTNAASSVAELVTSTVVLDDVGRGSTGGDLVIGGLSVGSTSTSRGVERFEVTVHDNSRLQTINSTNNALREVTIVNGATSNTVANAYRTTVTNEGDLTVNGTAFVSPLTGAAMDTIAAGNVLPGANLTVSSTGVNGTATAVPHVGAGAAGFTDVRLIDASAFTGKLAFTAAVSSDSIAKYVNSVDTQASPTGDVAGTGNVNFNVKGANFAYTGGNDNDTMMVTIDSGVASSRSTIVPGLSDFTFAMAGGAGDDAITVAVQGSGLKGGAQHWYNNQKLNANIAITGGDGNDTIRTPGAGDKLIDLGAGNDLVYTDNTGALAVATQATGTAGTAALAWANAAAAELAAGQAANVASNTTGFVYIAGTTTGAAVTTAAAAAALNTLNLATPAGTHAEVVASGQVIPVHSALIAAINTALASGGLTFDQANALQQAYGNWSTAGVVTPAATMIAQTLTTGTVVPDGTVVTAAQYDAGNALLDGYITAAKAAAATATANDALVAAGAAYNGVGANAAGELLNGTQQAVVAATMAVNGVYDPAAAAGLTYTPVVATQGANETNTFQPTAMGVGDTIVVNGLTITSGGANAAAAIQAVLVSGVTAGTLTVTGAYGAGWTAAAGAGTTVTYTSTAIGNPADLADTGVNVTSAPMVAPTVVAAVAEVVNVTIAGTGATGETVTFDGVTHAVGGLAAAAVAALIDGEATDTTWTDTSAGAVLTVTSTAANAGVRADLVAGNFVTANTVVGTQTKVTNLAALNSALASGATDAQVVTALQAAISNGSISIAQGGALFTAATSSGVNSINATDLAAIAMIMTPLQTAATIANTTAAATLAAAVTADNTARDAVSTAIANDADGNDVHDTTGAANVSSPLAGDEAGSTETAAALATATAAVTAQQAVLTPLTTKASNLAALKSAIAVGSTDLQVITATTVAVGNGSITAGDKTAIDAAAGAAVPVPAGVVVAAEKTAVDLLITALQVTNDIAVDHNTRVLSDLSAVVTATTTANTISQAAAASGGANAAGTAPRAVFVFDTSNQAATYNAATMDDRNLADLKSSANDSNNFFNTTVTVSYKNIIASSVLAGTGYRTTDLEINQKIKELINTNAVLKTLLVATDGPANTLVVTSLIDGAQATTALGVTLTLPTTVTAADLAGATTAYGMAAGTTEAALLAAMATNKATFDTRGDYVTQFAESGAAGGNTTLVGANSTATTDNTITPATGDDIMVLSTTVGIDTMGSSNEKIVYGSDTLGADTIVNFAASGNGIDMLDFTALNGRGTVALNSFSLDKSIVIAAPTALGATVLTAAQIAALFTDSATAINHVYVAVDYTNIGSIWKVADAAGTSAGNVTATLVGTIDLADTTWGSLTAANFV